MPERRLRPGDLAELLQEIRDEIRRLKTRNRIVIGAGTNTYVIEVDPATGNLTSTHAATNNVTIIGTP